MKRLVLIIPLLGVSAFAGFYHYWDSTHGGAIVGCDRPGRGELYGEYRHRNGKHDAESDLARGKPRILTYGLPAPWRREYGEVLQRDYGVQLEVVAGCVVSPPLTDYVAAYNKTIEGYLTSVHGAGVFDKAYTEARRLYAERHAQ